MMKHIFLAVGNELDLPTLSLVKGTSSQCDICIMWAVIPTPHRPPLIYAVESHVPPHRLQFKTPVSAILDNPDRNGYSTD